VTQIRPYVSPSQLATFIECPRKWGWEKLENLRSKQKPSAALGERVHKILEAWMTSGTPPNRDETFLIEEKIYYPGQIAESGIHLLPPPGSGFVESMFSWRIFNGRIDFAWKGPECPAVLDHKTTSNLGYAKTPEDLKTDPQAIIYASAALEETQAHAVDLFWVYYKTSKPYKAERVHLRVSREYAAEQLRPLESLAHYMLDLRRSGTRAKDLPPNADACQNYGGCDFVSHCSLSSQEIIRSIYMNEMSLEEKVRAHKASQAAGGIPSVPLPPSMGAPQLPGGVPVVPLPHVPTVPQVPVLAAPQVPAVPAVAAPPPVPRWIPHPTNAAYEWLEGTEHTRLRQPDGINAPEVAQTTPRAQPAPMPAVQAAPAAPEPDESMAGDAFDTMDGDALKKFAADHGLEPKKGLREKNLRITVRTLYKAKLESQPSLPHVPPQVPQVPMVPIVPTEAAIRAIAPQAFPPIVPAAPAAPAASAAGFEPDEARLFGALEHATAVKYRTALVTQIAAAMLTAREPYDDVLELARTANSIVEAIERVSRESFRPPT
jgi:RecB family exonuclease